MVICWQTPLTGRHEEEQPCWRCCRCGVDPGSDSPERRSRCNEHRCLFLSKLVERRVEVDDAEQLAALDDVYLRPHGHGCDLVHATQVHVLADLCQHTSKRVSESLRVECVSISTSEAAPTCGGKLSTGIESNANGANGGPSCNCVDAHKHRKHVQRVPIQHLTVTDSGIEVQTESRVSVESSDVGTHHTRRCRLLFCLVVEQ